MNIQRRKGNNAIINDVYITFEPKPTIEQACTTFDFHRN